MRRIILEGVDNVGKSILAERIAKYYKLPVYHAERLDRAHMMRVVEDDLIKCYWRDKGIVFDRYYTSDLVYEPIMTGNVSPLYNIQGLLMQRLEEMEFVYITLDCPEEELRRRYEEQGDELQSFENILAAVEGYKHLHELVSCAKIMYNVAKGSIEENTASLIQLIEAVSPASGLVKEII